ncbi:MAG: tetratricopeptide repeat protein [Phormidesmis sp.]
MRRRLQKLASAFVITLSIGTFGACSPAPQTAEDWHRQGIVQTQEGDLDRAVESFERALMLENDNATMRVNRGLVRDELGDYEGATADYTKAIALEPTLTAAYYNRANSHHNLKQYKEAVDDYTTAIELETDFAYGYANRAINYELLGDIEPAIKDLNQALDIFRTNKDQENIERITAKLSELNQ